MLLLRAGLCRHSVNPMPAKINCDFTITRKDRDRKPSTPFSGRKLQYVMTKESSSSTRQPQGRLRHGWRLEAAPPLTERIPWAPCWYLPISRPAACGRHSHAIDQPLKLAAAAAWREKRRVSLTAEERQNHDACTLRGWLTKVKQDRQMPWNTQRRVARQSHAKHKISMIL